MYLEDSVPELEKKWRIALQVLQIEDAILISKGNKLFFRRVYFFQGTAYKIQMTSLKPISEHYQQTLFGEWEILSNCSSISGIPSVIDYQKHNVFEVITTQIIEGAPLSEVKISFYLAILVLYRLSVILFILSSRGISHNDISPRNIIVSQDSDFFLIDFDQVVVVNKFQAFCRNYFSRTNSQNSIYGSFITIVKYLVNQLTGNFVNSL